VGPYETCPYCGASVPKRVSLRVVRYGAVILALTGLLVLWYVAQKAQVPLVRVQDVGGAMNWAYVRLQGVITRYPSYDPASGYLKFWIDDGTGEAMISAYRNESQALIEMGMVPLIGDRVTVEGTLKVQEDFVALAVNAPEHVMVERPAPVPMPIDAITAAHVYQKVVVRGQVRETRVPYEGMVIWDIRDRTGKIAVTYDDALSSFGGELARVEPGDSVAVRGAVTLYRDQPQIALEGAGGLEILSEGVPVATDVRIGELVPGDIGRMVRVEAAIAGLQWLPGGSKYTLDDGSGTLALVLWDDVLSRGADGEHLQEGTWLDVQGPLSEYNGELQIVLELPIDVRVTQVQQPLISWVPLSAISTAYVGKRITTEGQIVDVAPFSSGSRYTLQDGAAELAFVFWQELLANCADGQALVPGAWASVQGKIQIYHNELEIVPDRAEDVAVVSTAVPLPVTLARMGELTSADQGRWVTVEGTVVEVFPFSQGIKGVLDDGSGTIVLLLWQEVYDEFPDRELLVPGAVVRAAGHIDEYQGDLEIVPAYGSDVAILEPRP
jgi:DNA/RNA endonuclease YhcR with UshA esterase domain